MGGRYSGPLSERPRLREDTPSVSALADLAAALLPPEHGGPPPDRAAAAARPPVHALPPPPRARPAADAMPPPARAGLGAGLVALEAAARARHGRRLGALNPDQRAGVLRA